MSDDKTIEVTVVVDFSSEATVGLKRQCTMPEKSTVFDALSATVPVSLRESSAWIILSKR